jgi:endogenous inhibitor of DNA gyrase (YacG/DUF329 family)
LSRREIPCPICKKTVAADAAAYPFCSDRCRLIDLGKWLGGGYVVPGREEQQDDDRKPSTPSTPDRSDDDG